jgi:hypothetical protein
MGAAPCASSAETGTRNMPLAARRPCPQTWHFLKNGVPLGLLVDCSVMFIPSDDFSGSMYQRRTSLFRISTEVESHRFVFSAILYEFHFPRRRNVAWSAMVVLFV